MKLSHFSALLLSPFVALTSSCCGDINTNKDPHLSPDGYLINDSTNSHLNINQPNSVKFFVEVSGSMNGFFSANKPTHFKSDVWQILSYYSPLAPNVTILTNSGKGVYLTL